jgi:hypothetical protein
MQRSEYGRVACVCEYDREYSGSVKGGNIVSQVPLGFK